MKIDKFQKKYKDGKYKNLRKKKSIFKNKFFWFSILAILILAGLFYLFFFSPIFEIKEIEAIDVNFSNKQEIEKVIQEKVENKFLFLKTKNIFVFKKAVLEKELLEQFPAIHDLEITKKLPKTILVKLIEKKPIAVGYFENNYFFIDEQGIAFKESKTEVIPKALPLIYFSNGLDLGHSKIRENDLKAVIEANEMIALKIGLEESHYLILDDRIELSLADNSFVLYFSAEKDISRQVDDLALILDEHIEPGQSIEYIDLRFDKVFIK
ncbi:cell division protein FtsQ/DivIB [Patescibacteria group bacterium]|nr:cell division protein FtsQ/DivIB [Patescibacteria group bacterium]MBU4078415.1 cell division protein FtsQ/DivIB [Patescibacteria group bacterium]